MSQYRKILLIVDPKLKPTAAYRRALWLAQTTGAELHLGLFDYSNAIAAVRFLNKDVMELAKRAYVREREEQLNDVCLELREQGYKAYSQVVWHSPVHEAIVAHVLQQQPDLVIKDVGHESAAKRLAFTPLDWHLLRLCPAPLLIVNSSAGRIPHRVIATVDTIHVEPGAATLNEDVVKAALEFSLQCNAELHLVHAFEGSEVFLGPEMQAGYPALANLYEQLRVLDEQKFETFAAHHGVPGNRKRILLGPADVAIVDYAEDSAFDVVVMGTVHRTGLERIIMGSTAERTLSRIACDVLAIKPAGFAQDLARHMGSPAPAPESAQACCTPAAHSGQNPPAQRPRHHARHQA